MTTIGQKVAGWVALAVIAFSLKAGYDARRRAEGAAAVERKARIETEVKLLGLKSRVDTIYAVDTIAFWRRISRTDTLIDTLLHSDTVTLTQRESVLVFVADSLTQQCKNIVTLCEQRVGIRDSLLKVVSKDRDYWKGKAGGSVITRTAAAAKWLLIGVGVGVLVRQ